MNGCGGLAALERNNFFYGKLMDVTQFEKEQRYFNQKRLLLNRLVTGSGVVCGLDLVADGEMVRIRPGIAIDGCGREIAVPEPDDIVVDPHQLTDAHGEPTGAPPPTSNVEICLAFAEELVDPVSVLVPDCDTPDGCAPSTFLEGYRVLVRAVNEDPPLPPACTLDEFLLPPPDRVLHARLSARVSAACIDPPTDPCVPLGRVELLAGGEVDVDPSAGRDLVYGNDLLFELILCLAGRVEQAVGALFLRYVAGDGQSGPPGEVLPTGLVVEVVDANGTAAPGVPVHFSVTAGDGTVNPDSGTTDPNGRATTAWKLGSDEHQAVSAAAAGAAFAVTFNAAAIT
jgi:hypothetical protein